ncbi:MAG TPA: hypothetical protein VMR31_17125 [Myxococcota bacterium]|nr:hypothetical protein [Myxococcota bacterium]
MTSARAGSAASVAAALALLGGAPRFAVAQAEEASVEPQAPASAPAQHALPPIHIRIVIARADEAEHETAPGAQDILDHLPGKYHSVSVLDDRTVAVLLDEQAHVPLPNGHEVVLRPMNVHGGKLHLELEIPDVLTTSMMMPDSRPYYVGGMRLDQGRLVFKLVPEFSAYVGEPNQTRLADQPVTPNVQPTANTTHR